VNLRENEWPGLDQVVWNRQRKRRTTTSLVAKTARAGDITHSNNYLCKGRGCLTATIAKIRLLDRLLEGLELQCDSPSPSLQNHATAFDSIQTPPSHFFCNGFRLDMGPRRGTPAFDDKNPTKGYFSSTWVSDTWLSDLEGEDSGDQRLAQTLRSCCVVVSVAAGDFIGGMQALVENSLASVVSCCESSLGLDDLVMAQTDTAKQSEEVRNIMVEVARTQLAAVSAALKFWGGWVASAEKYTQKLGAELTRVSEGTDDSQQFVGRLTDFSREYLREIITLTPAAVDHFASEIEKISQRAGKPAPPRTRKARAKA
jgi:hypothetical protein